MFLMKTFFLSEVGRLRPITINSAIKINVVFIAEQKVDGETFLDLSSKSDYEHRLQHNFTLGAKTKLNKLMKEIRKGPTGMFSY